MSRPSVIDAINREIIPRLAETLLDRQIPFVFVPAMGSPDAAKVGPWLLRAYQDLSRFAEQCESGIEHLLMAMPEDYRVVARDDVAALPPVDQTSAVLRWTIVWLLDSVTEQGPIAPSAPFRNSRVWNDFPSIHELISHEGLVRVDGNPHFSVDGLRIGRHRVPLHPWLASCSELARLLSDEAAAAENEVFVALDGRCYSEATESSRIKRKDSWFGRPYCRSDLADRNATGLTVHLAPDLQTAPRIYGACRLAGILRVEFYWQIKDGLKELQAEEVMRSDRRRPKFIHSLFDMSMQAFEHIDGAVMLYAAEDRATRSDPKCKLPRCPKAHQKPKLFRIDGVISIDRWSEIVSLFFRGNPLVPEYLCGHTGPSTDSMFWTA